MAAAHDLFRFRERAVDDERVCRRGSRDPGAVRRRAGQAAIRSRSWRRRVSRERGVRSASCDRSGPGRRRGVALAAYRVVPLLISNKKPCMTPIERELVPIVAPYPPRSTPPTANDPGTDRRPLPRTSRAVILATLIRRLGDFDLAEESLQEAFAAAIDQWPREGAPEQPIAWLVQTATHQSHRPACGAAASTPRSSGSSPRSPRSSVRPGAVDDQPIPDDLLRLLFTCCHSRARDRRPGGAALCDARRPHDRRDRARVPVPVATLAQRLGPRQEEDPRRRHPYRIPESHAICLERLDAVLRRRVSPDLHRRATPRPQGDAPIRADLCAEAIRLARCSMRLFPDASEPRGLLALLPSSPTRAVAPASTATARSCRSRSRTVRTGIGRRSRKGPRCSTASSAVARSAPTRCKPAIAAVHGCAAAPRDTAWSEIAALYGAPRRASRRHPWSSSIARSRVAMAEGAERGLALLDEIEARGELDDYHSSRRRPGRSLPARRPPRRSSRASYRRALTLGGNEGERRFSSAASAR